MWGHLKCDPDLRWAPEAGRSCGPQWQLREDQEQLHLPLPVVVSVQPKVHHEETSSLMKRCVLKRNLCSHYALALLYEIAFWTVAVSELAASLVTLGGYFDMSSHITQGQRISYFNKSTFSQEIRPWFLQRAHLGLRAPSPPCIKEEDISKLARDSSQSLAARRF